MRYGVQETNLVNTILIQLGPAGTISVPKGAKLPQFGASTTESKIQEWSKKEFGTPIVGLIPVIQYYMSDYVSGGIFDGTTITDAAIKELQTKLGLKADGLIGAKTYKELGISADGVNIYRPARTEEMVFGGTADVGGLWYQSRAVKIGGGVLAATIFGYGIYYFMRDKDSKDT